MNFDDCHVVHELEIPDSLVQVTVDEVEMQSRIRLFIELKREENNENNLRDFIDEGNEDSCARVSSNVYRIKDSKGHLRIRRIKNETGPLDHRNGNTNEPQSNISFSGVSERLENVEDFLEFECKSVPKDVYHRLKLIEDQIAHLKTISPEYSKFLIRKDSAPKRKTFYTISDLDKIIASMESTGDHVDASSKRFS